MLHQRATEMKFLEIQTEISGEDILAGLGSVKPVRWAASVLALAVTRRSSHVGFR